MTMESGIWRLRRLIPGGEVQDLADQKDAVASAADRVEADFDRKLGAILAFTDNFGDYSSVTGRFWHGPRNQTWDRAIRRVGGPLGVVEQVPSRFSLSLPSDSQIGPGNRATVSQLGTLRWALFE